jgi:hypothetical protein
MLHVSFIRAELQDCPKASKQHIRTPFSIFWPIKKSKEI